MKKKKLSLKDINNEINYLNNELIKIQNKIIELEKEKLIAIGNKMEKIAEGKKMSLEELINLMENIKGEAHE